MATLVIDNEVRIFSDGARALSTPFVKHSTGNAVHVNCTRPDVRDETSKQHTIKPNFLCALLSVPSQ